MGYLQLSFGAEPGRQPNDDGIRVTQESLTIAPRYLSPALEALIYTADPSASRGCHNRNDFFALPIEHGQNYKGVTLLPGNLVAAYTRTEVLGDDIRFRDTVFNDDPGYEPEQEDNPSLLLDALLFCNAVKTYIEQDLRGASGAITAVDAKGVAVDRMTHKITQALSVSRQPTGNESLVTLFALRRQACRWQQANTGSAMGLFAGLNQVQKADTDNMLKWVGAALREHAKH